MAALGEAIREAAVAGDMATVRVAVAAAAELADDEGRQSRIRDDTDSRDRGGRG